MAYRVGIVGGTWIAASAPKAPPPYPLKNQIIVSHASCLALNPRAEVAALCDLKPELLEDFKKTWGAKWPKANVYTSYKEMLAKEKLDALTVVTPDNLHANITVDAANAGVRAIFCEKPIATSLEDADRMIDACLKNGTLLVVGHTRRWAPLYHKVRDTIRAGSIGQLSSIVATLGGPRAMLFRNGTHMLDAVSFFADSEPVQVFARLEDGFDHWDRYKGDGGREPANDPGVSGFIIFKNGVRTHYAGMKNTLATYTVQLSGPNGQINFGLEDRTAELQTAGPGPGDLLRLTLRPDFFQVHGLVAAYEEMFDILEKGGQSISSATEGRKVLQIMLGFLKSHQEGGRLVTVPN
ncbi:MAG: Gfo/Idh/MocA family oxidoreductase [SAR202 cluster bacterium]|nr:Gfo/Idh/MocA family oxidoreductase [SAR202 cluster bacterium]